MEELSTYLIVFGAGAGVGIGSSKLYSLIIRITISTSTGSNLKFLATGCGSSKEVVDNCSKVC